jgi:hypothetical protein
LGDTTEAASRLVVRILVWDMYASIQKNWWNIWEYITCWNGVLKINELFQGHVLKWPR